MEALRFTAESKKLEFLKIPLPQITDPNTILVKVAYSGICGTDLHIIQGEFPCNQETTFTLGHEFSGIVVNVGSNVKQFKKDDRVAIDPNNGCHTCNFCHLGQPHLCKNGGIFNTIGIYQDGGWANYALVPEEQVYKLPDSITLEQAALCEPLSCLAHGWDIISPIHVGQKILITGAGIIGNLWACALHVQGHRNVTVSEPNQARLDLLKKLNTGYQLITPQQLKHNQEKYPDDLFDIVIDCSGYPRATEHAFDLLNRGGKLCVFGVAPPSGRITISPFDIYMNEITIYGVNINPFTFPKAIGLIEAMGDRYLNYDNLGIKLFELKDYQKALDELKAGGISKAIFKF